ncbi:MAG: flagellar basal body P-ring formation chaperone FlgA [Syntrophales bacterium]
MMAASLLKLTRYRVSVIFVTAFLLLSAIQAQAATIAADDIKAAVTNYVEKNSRWPAGCVRVSFLSRVADEELPVSAVSLKVNSRSGEDFIDYSSLNVAFYSEGTLLRKRSVTVSMEVLADVVVSTRPLPRNRIIETGDLYVQKRWLRTIPVNRIALSEAVGKVLTMTVGANREITSNMLGEPTLVKRGEIVRIVLDNDVLKVAAVGVSEEAGCKNQVIRVKNISSSRVIYARVAGGDTVLVDF